MQSRQIDMKQYARRDHFDYFRTLAYPYVGVTVDVDVTSLVRFCREQRCSFYLTFLHAAALAADDVPELRQRIRGDGIVEYGECPSSHIELLENGVYAYCTLHHHMDFRDYILRAEDARAKCRMSASIEEDADVESMYFISALPWLRYTALIQPVAGGNESNPRITWGKYEENPGGELMMPVTLLAHHALVDGIHIAAFFSALSRKMDELTS